MSSLRLTPAEYQAVCSLCLPLDLHACPLPRFRRVLVGCLAGVLPDLAERLCRLSRPELLTLLNHLRDKWRPARGHDLTAEEVRFLAVSCGPLLWHARFGCRLKGALVRSLRGGSPALAGKLNRLTACQFEALCAQVKEQLRKP